MKGKITLSAMAALLVLGFIATDAFTASTHRIIDRSTTSIGLTANPDSLGTTAEVTLMQSIPTTGDSIAFNFWTSDSCSLQVQVTARGGADTAWVTDTTVVADSAVFTAIKIPVPVDFMAVGAGNDNATAGGYRIRLSDVQGAAMNVRCWESLYFTPWSRR